MEAIKTMVLELLAAQKKPGDEDPEAKSKDEDPEADPAKDADPAEDEDPAADADPDEAYAEGDEERAIEKVEEAIEEIEEAAKDMAKASDGAKRKAAQDRMTRATSKLARAKAERKRVAADTAMRKRAAKDGALAKQVAKLQQELAAIKSPAKDSAPLLGLIADRDALYSQVSHFTGAFDHSRMDAKAVAVYACDKLSIKCEKGQESVALNAWMQGRKPEQPSGHAADTAKRGGAFAKWSEQ